LVASVRDGEQDPSAGLGFFVVASMGLAAAAGAPAAGVLVVFGGFTTLCLAAAAVATAILTGTRTGLHGQAAPGPPERGPIP
jgi:hypothetical protein